MDLQSLYSLQGKIALVTGGSRGIGAMIAEGLVAAGCRVYISSRTADECRQTARRLSDNYESDCIAVPGDLSSNDGVDALADDISCREQTVNILINNAGAIWAESFESFPEMGWDKVMTLNTKSAFFLTQRMLKLLKAGASADDPARVINITSILGARSDAMDNYSYCASKAALVQMTRNLAYDLARESITVNGIAPGFFPSNMTASIMEDEDANTALLKLARFWRYGTTEDIAGLASYLCSKSGSFVTGENIAVDGGLLLSC